MNQLSYISPFQMLLLILVVSDLMPVHCFTVPQRQSVLDLKRGSGSPISPVIRSEAEDDVEEKTEEEIEAAKISLEEKMKNWEATEEELKAASLGGLTQKKGDGNIGSFDVGLYIAFPFMIIACLLFLAFPFLAGNLDVSSVGPPPTT